MAFENYKDLDGRPEKVTSEEIEVLKKKYGVNDYNTRPDGEGSKKEIHM